jgi:hypothetical protein
MDMLSQILNDKTQDVGKTLTGENMTKILSNIGAVISATIFAFC